MHHLQQDEVHQLTEGQSHYLQEEEHVGAHGINPNVRACQSFEEFNQGMFLLIPSHTSKCTVCTNNFQSSHYCNFQLFMKTINKMEIPAFRVHMNKMILA